MQFSLLLPANFCEVEQAINRFLSLLQAPLIKVKAHFLLWQRLCQNHADVLVGRGLTNFDLPDSFFCIKEIIQAVILVSSSANAKQSFYAKTDKI